MTKHITEDLTNPRELNPALSRGVADLIMKMMEKEPSARQQAPEELILDLKTVMETGELPNATRLRNRSKTKRRSGLRRGRRVRKKSPSTRRSTKVRRKVIEESSENLDVTTAEFMVSDSDMNLPPVKVDCEEMLKQAKECKEFAKKEALLLQAMSDESEENDIISLEAKCRYAYLISVVRKEEAIETLLEIIEDFIEYADNKYYGLAENKLKELNHS